MKMNVNELTGSKLDWAVSKCEGYDCLFDDEVSGAWLVPQQGYLHDEKPLSRFSPSTDWAQGGPIIEREKINIHSNMTRMAKYPDYDWLADCPEHRQCVSFTGQTPLIAAMRCYVASKLGDVIDIPEELF